MQSGQTQVKGLIIIGMLLITPLAVCKVILKDGDRSHLEELMSMTGHLPFWTTVIN